MEEEPQMVTGTRARLTDEPLPDGMMAFVVGAYVSSVLGVTGGEVIPCKICRWGEDNFGARSARICTTYLP